MPVIWNLKRWLAVEHNIYRPTELQALLAAEAGVQLSLPAISSLLNKKPDALRLHTIQALCNALHCTLSDFCEILPDDSRAPLHLRSTSPLMSMVREQKIRYQVAEAMGESSSQQEIEIDPTMRRIILRILEEQGLVPRNPVPARTTPRTRLIGMLIPTWAWPLIPDLTRGIVEVVTQTAYDLVLYSLNEDDPQRDAGEVIDRLLAAQLTAGLLAVFPGRVSPLLTALYQQGFPVVTIDDQREPSTPWVSADNATGAYQAVSHLVKLGHRRIAHIKGPAEYLVSQERYAGYSRALREAGIEPDPRLVLQGDFLPPSGRACASALFSLPPEQRPTAIFAASDQMAYGVITAAEACGLAIPRDVALIGFDDDAPSAHVHPALTTVRQPYFEMGQQGIKLLMSLLNAAEQPGGTVAAMEAHMHGAGQSVHLQLDTHLIVRASCGADYHIAVSSTDEALL